MEIPNFAKNVYYKDGLWFSKSMEDISYPNEGNQNCFQIEQDSFWFNHRNNCIIEAVKTFSPNAVFFDIGGGNGFVSKGLENHNIKTVLIEPGIQGALNAKKRGLTDIVCSTLEDADFKLSTIESIGLFDVVEHIEDDLSFMKHINSYLTHDGLVYITVPSYNFLWSKEDKDAGHFRRYTLKRMKTLLSLSGFKIEFSTYLFSILPIPIFLFRTIPSALGLNKNSNELDKHKKEHSKSKGIVTNLLDNIWKKELNRIKMNKKIPFGSSCFIIARKIPTSKI